MSKVLGSLTALILLSPALLAGCGEGEGDVAGTNYEDVGSEEDAVKVCADGSTIKGVDVSYYQGNVDWSAAKKGGISFAIARVSDGTGFIDPEFADNWAGMKKAGVVRGTYQFFRPSQDPIAQADLLISQIKKHGGLDAGDIPPTLDVEVTDGVSDATLRSRMAKWLEHVEAAFDRRPIIYTSPGFWDGLGAGTSFGKYTLWVANWQTSCPSMPSSWADWKFWQSADNGSVPGIKGAVDVDRFNGTLAELLKYTGAGGGGGNNDGGLNSLGGKLAGDPVVVRNADGRLELFGIGTDGTLKTAFQTEPNGGWSDWFSLSGSLKGKLAVGTNEDGRIEVFGRGDDDAIWHAWQDAPNGKMGAWHSLGGKAAGDPEVGKNKDGRLELFVRGTDGAIHHDWQTAPNGGWSGWAKLGTAGGGLHAPHVTRAAGGHLAVVARGEDKATWLIEQNSKGGWTTWTSLGGGITSAPVITRNEDGRLEVFGRGTDGALWHTWEKSPNGAFTGWASLGGGIHAPYAASDADGRIEVFARGDNDALYRITQKTPNGGWTGWVKIGGKVEGGPAAMRNKDGRLEVFARTASGAVVNHWQKSAGDW